MDEINSLKKEIDSLKASIGIFQSTVKEHGNSLEKLEKKIHLNSESLKKHMTIELDKFAQNLTPVIKLSVVEGVHSGLIEHEKLCKAANSFPDFKSEVGEIKGQIKEASRQFNIEKEPTTSSLRKKAARGEISLSGIDTGKKEDIRVGITIPRGVIKWAIGIFVVALSSLFGIKGIGYMVKNPGQTIVPYRDDTEGPAKAVHVVGK